MCIRDRLKLYRDLLPKWRDLGHRAAVAHELECIAYILAKQDELQRAVMILGAADHLRKTIDSIPTPMELVEYEQELIAMRGKMKESEFERAWQEGQRLNLEEAIALAVREDIHAPENHRD